MSGSSSGKRFTLPDKQTLISKMDQKQMDKSVYEGYEIVVEVVNNADEPLAFEHARQRADERGFEGKFKSRFISALEWEPGLLD